MIEYFKFKNGVMEVTKIEHNPMARIKAKQDKLRLEVQGYIDDFIETTQQLPDVERIMQDLEIEADQFQEVEKYLMQYDSFPV
jgi:hypothetical protein